ncbi:MAG: tetratricopeptide repeat protein [Thermodesulfobacteriota bacterium]
MSVIQTNSGVPDDEFLREGLIDRLQQYLAAEPGAWHVRYNLAVALMHSGQADQALEHFRQVLQYAPKHMESLVNIGGIHLSRGEADQALRAFTSALSVWDVPLVRANLAVAYIQLGQFDEAERHLREALKQNPDLPDALTNLGSVLLRGERFAESAELSRRAIALSPEFAMAHNNLALALLALGQEDEARGHVAEAHRLGYPVHPELLAGLGLA